MIEQLQELTRDRIRIEIRDIDCDDHWRQKYDLRVPVLEFEGRSISEVRLDENAVATVLATLADN